MFLHKNNVTMTILFSLTSVTLITVNGGGIQSAYQRFRSDEDGISDADPPGSQSPEYVSPSDEVSGKDYVGYTLCWKKMKEECGKENPEAIDFAKIAITKWTDEVLYDESHLRKYYHTFRPFLDAEDILFPEDYCLIFESRPIPRIPPQPIENTGENCLRVLSDFGDTNQKALEYGFYETKVHVLDYSDVMLGVSMIKSQNRDYSGNYLKFMANNVKLRSGYQSPLQFCKEYDAEMMIEHQRNSQNT